MIEPRCLIIVAVKLRCYHVSCGAGCELVHTVRPTARPHCSFIGPKTIALSLFPRRLERARRSAGDPTATEVDASPHKPTPPEILEQYRGMKINLNALFDGKSPFDTDERGEELDAAEFRPKVVKGMKARSMKAPCRSNRTRRKTPPLMRRRFAIHAHSGQFR